MKTQKMIKVLCIYLALLSMGSFESSGQQTRLDNSDFENSEELINLLDFKIQEEMKESKIPGLSIAIVKDDRVIISKGYGIGSITDRNVVTDDQTLFRIGSITKVFTGVAIRQLIEKELIAPEDDVNKYLPNDLKIADRFKEPVRVWHLLSHTAGFDQDLSGRVFDSSSERHDFKKALQGKLVRIRPSGQVSCYDTYGMVLMGIIIEKVSGLSYSDYLTENIFKPLGMNKSFVEVPDNLRESLAIGYRPRDGELIEQQYEWFSSLPASSIDAATADMAKFMMSVLNDGKGILSKTEGKNLFNTTFTNYPGFPGYANTFWEQTFRGVRTVGHGGVMDGYQSNLVLIPEYKIGIYIVYNLESPAINLREVVVDKLMERWFPDYEVTKPEMDAPFPIDTKALEGAYASNLYCHTCYEGEAGVSRNVFPVTSGGTGKISFWGLNFWAMSHDTFISQSGKTKAVFKRNDKGEVRHLLINTSNYVFEKLGEPLIKEVLGVESLDGSSPIEAMTYRGMREWDKAAESYQKIVEQRPADAIAHYYLGVVRRNNKEPELAIEAFGKAYKLKTWSEHSAHMLAEIFIVDMKDKDKALDWIRKALNAGLSKEQLLRNPAFKVIEDDIKAL